MKFKKGQRVKLLKTDEIEGVVEGDTAIVDSIGDDFIQVILDKSNKLLSICERAYEFVEIIEDSHNEYDTEEYDPYKEIKKLKKIIKMLLE